jgi:Ca2+-binding RTX toxin-like protein
VAYFYGTQDNNRLYGGSANDIFYGGAGNDSLYGRAGDDFIHGGTGSDRMYGDAGNDIFVVMDTGDQIVEYAGGGYDTVRAHVNYTLPANVENLELQERLVYYPSLMDNPKTFGAPIYGTGNDLSNVINGNSRGNNLSGLGGNDVIYGRGGVDLIQGGFGDDALFGGDGADLLDGGDGNDNLYGDADNDILSGGSGNDYLNGGTGIDFMYGNTGNDYYVVDNTGDVVSEYANSGIDTVSASVTYSLTDNVENLKLTGSSNINGTGNSLNNQIYGNAGDNNLVGGAGNDSLSGYSWSTYEYDILTGGTGSDRFVLGDCQGCYYTGGGYAVITDFDPYTPGTFPYLSFDFEYDMIQVTEPLSDYTLRQENWVGSATLDTVIYKGIDRIGIVQDTTNVSLTRDFIAVPYCPLI